MTPLDSKRHGSVGAVDNNASKYEVKYSPERQNLIERMKQRRQERATNRMNNSMRVMSNREPATMRSHGSEFKL